MNFILNLKKKIWGVTDKLSTKNVWLKNSQLLITFIVALILWYKLFKYLFCYKVKDIRQIKKDKKIKDIN